MSEPTVGRSPSSRRIEEARQALARTWALTKLNGKKPVFKGWQTRKPDDLNAITQWIVKDHNLGLRTGRVSGVIVVDDDSADASASTALNLPRTVTALTGSGKKHFYFKAPDFKVGNSVKTIADGIDIRGDGGQVVFVGSIHPDTQMPYEWAPGLAPDDVELAELPEALLEKLRPRPKPSKLKLADAPTHGFSKKQMIRFDAYAEAALESEADLVASAPEGSRNDQLNKSAFAVGTLVGAGVLSRDRARSRLANAAAQAGLSDGEAEATIESGLSSGEKSPRDLQEVEQDAAAGISPDAPERSKDPRPLLRMNAGWLHKATTKAEKILLQRLPPLIYQRGTTLVRVSLVAEGSQRSGVRKKPHIVEMTTPSIIDHLTRLVRFEKFDRRQKGYVTIDCPESLAKTLSSRSGEWALPVLSGIIEVPTVCADGRILDTPGYDKLSGIYLAPCGISFPPVPVEPTRDDAIQALELLRWILKGFPFLEPVDCSVVLAAILTALIRPSLRTAPLFAFRAAKMGSGKSLLADVVALIATGREASVMSQGADENEDKKRMLPILMEGDPVAVIDNIDRPFGSAALCSILTQASWRDRVLGKSQTLSLPTTNTTWIATGNNIQFAGDVTTRTLTCDLDPPCERPEERQFDVNLHKYIPAHRGELVVAGLTILRAYFVAGRPPMPGAVFGRFEEWSDWVRACLIWLDQPDPCDTRRRVEETDPIRQQLVALLSSLHTEFGTQTFRVADVIDRLDEAQDISASVRPILSTASQGQGAAQCLGLFFQRVHRRVEGGLRLLRSNDRGGAATWRVERV